MEISLWTVAMPIGLTVLCILLTGPGMWSEKWGWNLLEKRRKKQADAEPAPAPDEKK